MMRREDLYNDNYMEDYRRMDENDLYESVGPDDSMEDERDIDQIMEDWRATKVELDAKEGNMGPVSRKLPRLLHDKDIDDEINYRHLKRSTADFRLPRGPRSYDDTDGGTPSSPGRSQRGHLRDDVPMTDQTEDEPYEEEDDDEGEFEIYRVQGTLREWVTRDEVHWFIAKKFKEFLLILLLTKWIVLIQKNLGLFKMLLPKCSEGMEML
ncbi:DNA replication licensing factor MCM2-like [Magnolia sinica]|uniref:DNA replication licensing factor MCM2-like n=1 Tax=Magnolia sinica TaxID=86752 RepID=UPI00265A5B47|nr:DNA replication licensing factor MCM2-like [Magnolia sinica]